MSKRVLSLVLAFTMILGTFSFVAAETDYADHWAAKDIEYLMENDIIKGFPDGSFKPGNKVTRAQLATIINGALKLTDAAEIDFSDVNEGAWYYDAIAIAVEAGYMDGYPDGTMNPNGDVKRQEAAKMFVEAFGVEESEADLTFNDADKIQAWAVPYVKSAVAADLMSGHTSGNFAPLGTLIRAEAARMTINALGIDLDEAEELEVVSVSAINAKEIVIQFNQNLDEVTAGSTAYYELEVANVAATFTVEFDEDNADQVVLVVDSPIANGSVVSVIVDKDVLDANLNSLGEDYTELFVFSDTEAPSIVKIEKVGSDVVVTFDEYISSTIGLVKFNNVTYGSGSYSVSDKELTISNGALNLANGTYELVLNAVSDLVPTVSTVSAPNVSGLLTTSLTIVADTTAPVVNSVKQVGDTLVRVTFNKPVDPVVGSTPVTVTKNGYQLTVSAPAINSDKTQYTYTLSDNTPVKVYDDNTDTSAIVVTVNGFKDAGGTIANKFTQSLTISKDKAAPVVVSRFNEINNIGTPGSEDEVFDIYFDKAIEIVDPANASSKVVLTDDDGVRQTVSGVTVVADSNGDDKILRIASTAVQTTGIIDAGEYTLTLPTGLVKDTSITENKNASVIVKLTKSGAPASGLAPTASAAANVITVNYGAAMSNSATVVSNYRLDGKALPAGTVVYFDTDNQTVKIELPDSSVAVTGGGVLTILDNVVSTTGVKVANANKNISIPNGLVDNIDPVLTSAKKTSTTEIELTFSEAVVLSGVANDDIDDFTITINGVEVTPTAITSGSSANKLVLTVQTYNTSQEVRVVVDATATIDIADTDGNTLVTGTVVVAQ